MAPAAAETGPGPTPTGPATPVKVAVRAREGGHDFIQDASSGLPAVSADRAHIAFLFSDVDIAGFSNLSFQVFSTNGGALERQIQIVDGEEILHELEDGPTGMMERIDERVRTANEALGRGRFTPMLSAAGRGESDEAFVLGELRAVLDHDRFRVTGRGGATRLDVDAARWAAPPLRLGQAECTFRAAPTLVAVDASFRLLAVVVEQIGRGAGDACAANRSVEIFELHGSARGTSP